MKKVLVTGDSGDLGQAITRRLLQNSDYAVIGVSRSTTVQIDELLKSHKELYLHISFDLLDPSGIKDFYLEQLKELGPFHGLVNNAAFPYDDITTNADPVKLDKMFRINFYAPVMLTKYLIRDMLLHDTSGSLVHISSVSAHTGYKGLSMYAASKGALEAFSRTVAREWGEKGIRSNCVAPGFMETKMSSSLSADQKDRIYRRTALRNQTDISSVADTVEFLLSDRASSITGSVLHVDNGTI